MESLYLWLIHPITTYPFIATAVMAGCIIGIVCAILSCFMVLKSWSLMGDAVSHAVLPGIAIAEVVGFAHLIGAFISGLICALLTGFVSDHSRVKQDTVMGVIFSGMFALGILMVSRIKTTVHLDHIVQGNLLGTTTSELIQIAVIGAVVIAVMAAKWKEFLLYCFDVSHARVIGLPVKALHYGLLIMLALTIVASVQAVGVVMVVALLIAPGITGFVLTKRFSVMMIIAMLSSVIATYIGVIASFHLNAATAPCIVLVQAILFVIALVIKQCRANLLSADARKNIPASAS